MKEGPALMIGISPKDGKSGDYDSAEAGEESIGSPGEMAFAAMCKAKDRGDYAAGYEAFKEMLAAADDELGPAEEEPPPIM